MIRRVTPRRVRRRGSVAVVVTLCLVPLIGIMAFAIDGGLLLASKRRSQTVADAAAHAAACVLYADLKAGTDLTGLDLLGKARAAAFLNASANGFTNDGTTNAVTVNIPPIESTVFKGKAGYAEILVTYIQPRIFGTVLGSGSLTIGANAVARGIIAPSTPYSSASLIVLNPTASNALQVSGAANIIAQAGVQVNSSSVTAANANNAGTVTASAIQITGNYVTSGSGKLTTTSGAAVQTAAPVMADPLASVAAPSASSLTAQSFQSTYGSKTISPGVYSGGLSIGNGMSITMLPGIYYMKGGDFSIAGGVTLVGNGVTIYLDNAGSQFSIQGGANVTLTPPTSGTYAGLTVYEDRSSTQALNIANGSINNISGTIYAAGAAASIAGGSTNKYGSQLIVSTINVSNGATVNLTTTTDAKFGYVASGSAGPNIRTVQ